MTNRIQIRALAAFLTASALALPARVSAQELRLEGVGQTPTASIRTALVEFTAPPRPDRERFVRALAEASLAQGAPLQRPAPASAPRRRSRGVGRIIAGAAVGAVGGFFAGGFLGAAIEGDDCNCDDPGFKGFLIGAPTGAIAGGILGGKFLF